MLKRPPTVHFSVLPKSLRPVLRNLDAARQLAVRAASSCPETQTGRTAIPHQRHIPTTLQSQLSALQHVDVGPLQDTVSSEAVDAMRR